MQSQSQTTLAQASSACTSRACPNCKKNEYVTVEQLIVGEQVLTLCYCKACEFSWKLAAKKQPASLDRSG
jgi:DNA-directed RNA polymerase subunit M/transcription elongation factor TFIIS